MATEEDPVLIFTTRVSKCANGYHLKIRKSDVEMLKLEHKTVKIKVYTIEEETMDEDPYEKLLKD